MNPPCTEAGYLLILSAQQDSAFRGASERYATLAETSTTLLTSKEAAAEAAGKALEDLAAAKTAATAAHAELSALKTKLLNTRNQFESAHTADIDVFAFA